MSHLSAGRSRRLPILVALALLTGSAPVQDPPAFPAVAEELWSRLSELRAEAGQRPLERQRRLDVLATRRARELATLPEAHRQIGLPTTLDAFFVKEGLRQFRRAGEHLDLKRGYEDLSAAFANTWVSSGRARALSLDPAMDAVGIAVVRATDGWVILDALFVEDLTGPTNLLELEQQAIEAVNAVREEHDLAPLIPTEALTQVARSHSEDMALRGFFDHVNPDGETSADRVRARGITYRSVAENIQFNNDTEPVRLAVQQWLESASHRRNILTAGFTHTGMGVATDDHANVYFTQLFLERPDGLNDG